MNVQEFRKCWFYPHFMNPLLGSLPKIGFTLSVFCVGSFYLGLAGVVRKGHGGEQVRARKKAHFIQRIAESAGKAMKVAQTVW